jgi:alpha-glucosidase
VWSVSDTTAVEQLLDLRTKIGPYIFSLAEESVTTAEPIIRHLEYQFPRTGFTNCKDEYMIGNRYLVAPVISDSGSRMVRLPKGKWKGPDGRKIKGPRVIDLTTTGEDIVIFEQTE